MGLERGLMQQTKCQVYSGISDATCRAKHRSNLTACVRDANGLGVQRSHTKSELKTTRCCALGTEGGLMGDVQR